jgi:NADH-quinone oxidoreductase subunit H
MYDLYAKTLNIIGIPEFFAQISWPVIPFIFVAALLVLVVIFLVLMERKFLAWLTIRKGPNRVGPNGFLQTFADAIKLLFKEDIMSKDTNKVLFTLAPIITFAPVMVIYGLMPFTEYLVAINLAIGLFLVFALSSVTTVGIVLAGWSSNNKYSLLGGMRSAAQAISYEIPLVVAVLSVAVLAGSLNLTEIVKAQEGGLLHWNILPAFIGFVVLFICSIAEVNRVPFDLPEAESELVSGYNTEYSGMKFALFFLAEYAALFIMSVLVATLFLGGYLSPFGTYISAFLFGSILPAQLVNTFVHIEQGFWLVVKVYALLYAIIWIRGTLPRLRADQLMSFSWKFLLPLAFFNLLVVSIIKLVF